MTQIAALTTDPQLIELLRGSGLKISQIGDVKQVIRSLGEHL